VFTVTVTTVDPAGKLTKFTLIWLQEMAIEASFALAGPAHNTSTPETMSTTPAMAATTLALALRTTPPFHSRLHELTVAARWRTAGGSTGQGATYPVADPQNIGPYLHIRQQPSYDAIRPRRAGRALPPPV
jgi:hypothetical protein